ncbi:S-type pyocin domain-containing protein [Pseudomonas xanthosomatis]|uniref:S-type pyocin domain-containing protein n=1 Tax=Pseudomonas xanthosomatis TaxID=2842356 RepID=UPI001C3E7102|nr:S-type pyocin domain-containing protein [Pseudomonas xanthosomatis]QXH44864.1 S-type pyocin domain-containing protein [Pseudomonas xanthosomatis]
MQGPVTLPPILITPDHPSYKNNHVTLPNFSFGSGSLLSTSQDIRKMSPGGPQNFLSLKLLALVTHNVSSISLSDQKTANQKKVTQALSTPASTETHPLSNLIAQRSTVLNLIQNAQLELPSLEMDAKAFYGENPFQTDITKASDSFQARAVKIDKRSTGPAHEQLVKSYNAAINLALAEQTIALSQQALADLNSKIEALEAAAQVEAEIDRIAAEAAAQAEAARIAAHHELMRQANTFSAAGAAAIAGPLLVTPAGTVLSTLSLLGEIKASITALKGLGSGVLAGFAVGTFAMLYPSRLGNGELPARYVLQTPLAELDPHLASTLANGSAATPLVELPYRFGSKPGEAGSSEIFTATSDGQLVPPQVRVIAATFDTQRNLYSATTADVPPRTLTWTPVVTPGDASTVTPIEHIEPPVYEGATLKPVEARVDSYPGLGDASWDDYVIVFPADSGLPPLYVLFNSPYPGATTVGAYSGRPYNPEKAGGPIENLDWQQADITREGVDLVILHTNRFPVSDANRIMIGRLEQILRGELDIIDTDKRFYTHEIRELERFRALGVEDTTLPMDRGETWNNTHAASLEDYKLHSNPELLYTPEALDADDLQIKREYP